MLGRSGAMRRDSVCGESPAGLPLTDPAGASEAHKEGAVSPSHPAH